ncbi:MAG: L-2-hydroxyglutarate oxidase [Pseudomonadota bacterium]|nr:L-2-hydroxyglutarate oxidase [Pseudomonadota bacterium]
MKNPDFLIIGGGIIGMGMAQTLKVRYPDASITILEKEPDVGRHASGRNSGVLHAGFYYSADSLKARFCRDGNRIWHAYCDEHGLKLNRCQKLVVARNESEITGLHELKRRGDVNGVPVKIIDEQAATEIEPNVRTHRYALLSPTTSTVDPLEICLHLRGRLQDSGIRILTGMPYRRRLSGNRILAGNTVFEAGMVINCAGLYASNIAHDFGFGLDYTILPFKGVYLNYTGTDRPLRTLLYMVPDMRKPFLGVQFAIGADGSIRIGPTAMPAFWRENYHGFGGFSLTEMATILRWQAELFLRNSFNFRTFALEEMRKYRKKTLIRHAFAMARNLDASKFSQWGRPGIRAQLLNTRTRQLVQDFTIEGDDRSIHILNANSPAFTSSLPFTEWVVETRVKG